MAHHSYVVTSAGDTTAHGTLRSAIHFANAHPGTTITFAAKLAHHTITLSSDLPLFDSKVTIDGGANHITISGGGQHRIFFADRGHITIENLTLVNGFAHGGDGGAGQLGDSGGGGMGAGGALFVRGSLGGHTPARVTLVNVGFRNDAAHGGNGGSDPSIFGGSSATGGGGGLGGNGGSNPSLHSGGGGGGGAFPGQDGESGPGGMGGGPNGGAGGNPGGPGGDFSGGGGASVNGASGGDGGFGGGAGGSTNAAGGSAGFGGGGGGNFIDAGGSGGFGGGGGGSGGPANQPGIGGFGGGNGGRGVANSAVGGGGGAGMGGAVFVMEGSHLIILGAGKLGGSVQGGNAGNGGTDGQAFGGGMFLEGSGTIRFNPGLGQTEHVSNAIDDQAGAEANGYTPPAGFTPGSYNLIKSGLGTLILSADNAYSGGTILKAGTLEVAAQFASGTGSLTGTGSITFAGTATLKIANSAFSNLFGHIFFGAPIDIFGKHDILDLTGLHFRHGATATYDNNDLFVHSGSLTYGLILLSPHGTHFAVANDGHGGTKVTLDPPHAATVASEATHHLDGSAHHLGDYLWVG